MENITNDKKYYYIDELKSFGFTQYKISKLVSSGKLIKINRKCYENADYMGEDLDYFCVNAYIPNGVVCLLSAAVYYNLTTFRMDSIDVAIPRKAKVSTLPEWPNITVHYFSDKRFDQGIETVEMGSNRFRIYDVEKTVCDIVYYKGQIGIEDTKQILLNYLKRRNRNLNKLIRYAEELKCLKVIESYLEVLI